MTKTGLGANSQILSGLSILIGGKNTFGFTGDGTKQPEFEFELINEESTGIVKQPKMTLEVCDLGAEHIAHITTGLPFVLKGNIKDDDENKPLLITAKCELLKMSSEIKEGDVLKRSFELRVDMYSEIVNGIPTIVYTRKPYHCVLGGINTASDFSSNI